MTNTTHNTMKNATVTVDLFDFTTRSWNTTIVGVVEYTDHTAASFKTDVTDMVEDFVKNGYNAGDHEWDLVVDYFDCRYWGDDETKKDFSFEVTL